MLKMLENFSGKENGVKHRMHRAAGMEIPKATAAADVDASRFFSLNEFSLRKTVTAPAVMPSMAVDTAKNAR